MSRPTRLRLPRLRRRPGVTFLVVVILAVGAGVAGAVFSILLGTAFQSLPFPDAERLVSVGAREVRSKALVLEIPAADFRKLRAESSSFGALAAHVSYYAFVTADRGPTQTYAASEISANLFALLGVAPAMGRGFTPEDELPSAEPVVVIGDRAWQELLARDREALGRSLWVNGESRQVVGVMPADFVFPELQQIWMNRPDRAAAGLPSDGGTVSVLGLLRRGTTLNGARAELGRFESPSAATGAKSMVLTAEPFTAAYTDPALLAGFPWMLLALAGLLALASANAANLLWFRALEQEGAWAVRLALGASRTRLLGAAARDALFLATATVALGLPLGALLIEIFNRVMAPSSALRGFWVDVRWTPTVAFLVAWVAVGTCFAAQVLPFWRLATSSRRAGLAARGRSLGDRRVYRLSRGLVVVQVALAVGLLVASGLFLRTLLELRGRELPFDASRVLLAKVSIAQRVGLKPPEILRFFDEVAREVRSIPGVRQVAFGGLAPTQGAMWTELEVEGHDGAQRSSWLVAGPGWFEVMGLGLLAGRDFNREDGPTSPPVALVSRSFAERWFGSASPLGHRLRRAGKSAEATAWATIVGVVPDLPLGGLESAERPVTVFYPHSQLPRASMEMAVATRSSPRALVPQLADRVAAVDRYAACFDARSLAEILRRRYWAFDSLALLFSGLAALALALASIGTYAVVSVVARQRVPEIGLRLALGADRQSVWKLMVAMGMRPILLGVVLGLAGAAVLGRALASLTFGFSPWDLRVYAGVSLLVVLSGLLAVWLPARRASEVAPASVLR